MFALHVHDFASELLAAAYAGDQEVALQAGEPGSPASSAHGQPSTIS